MKVVNFETKMNNNIVASKCNCGACNCNCGSGSACANKCMTGETVAYKKEIKKIYTK